MAAGLGLTLLDTKQAAVTGLGNVGKSKVATEPISGEIIGKSVSSQTGHERTGR